MVFSRVTRIPICLVFFANPYSVSLTKTIKSRKEDKNTLDNERKIIENITSYKSGKYKVKYQGGGNGSLTIRGIREGRPTRMSSLEIQYWNKQAKGRKRNIPSEVIPS